MDISQFTTSVPGEVIPISDGNHAFVPRSLPPNWKFSPELWPLLVEAKHQLGILEGLGRNLPNPAILLRPLEDREAIQSSRLEGTYATPKELLLFEMQPRESRSADDPVNDWREVFNYRKALSFGTTSDLPLSLRLLRQLHEILLAGVRGRDRTPGEFRRIQVAIGTSKRYIPPPPDRLMECLDPLEKYMHNESGLYDPVVDSFLVHYQFEAIHPFIDGNGRIGRLLLALLLQKRCGLSKPWLYMSEYYERHREEYIEHLFNISAKADWHGWVKFCLQGTISQARDTIDRCEQLRAIREQYTRRIADVGGSVRLNQIVEQIFHSPFIRIADLPKELGVTYPTAKTDVERLVQAGILMEVPNAAPKTFFAPDVFNIAYKGIDQE